MTEFLKCPNCNAQLHAEPDDKIIKCEYCDSEIIIDNNIHRTPPLQPVNNYINPENTVITGNYSGTAHYVNIGNYPEDLKKWKKKFHKKLIIQAVLTAFFGLLMETDAEGLGILMFLIATFQSFRLPIKLSHEKPLLPYVNNSRLLDFLKMYPAFAGAFWGGMIIIMMLLEM
ncbi:MAG: hypothetical protein K2J39_12465 [Ruminococcus sp.]|nr:hypothetical protein [Ruminococcus sp.]